MSNYNYLPWFIFKEYEGLPAGEYFEYAYEMNGFLTIDPYYLGGCV